MAKRYREDGLEKLEGTWALLGRTAPQSTEAWEALENMRTWSGPEANESTRIQEFAVTKKVSELGGVDMR